MRQFLAGLLAPDLPDPMLWTTPELPSSQQTSTPSCPDLTIIRSATDQTANPFQVSISPTFYDQLCHTKVFGAAFLNYNLGLYVLLWQKNIGVKAACKMMMKLTLCWGQKCAFGGSNDPRTDFLRPLREVEVVLSGPIVYPIATFDNSCKKEVKSIEQNKSQNRRKLRCRFSSKLPNKTNITLVKQNYILKLFKTCPLPPKMYCLYSRISREIVDKKWLFLYIFLSFQALWNLLKVLKNLNIVQKTTNNYQFDWKKVDLYNRVRMYEYSYIENKMSLVITKMLFKNCNVDLYS